MLSAVLDALPKAWRTWTFAVTQQGCLSLYRIHLLPPTLIVLNIFSGFLLWLMKAKRHLLMGTAGIWCVAHVIIQESHTVDASLLDGYI